LGNGLAGKSATQRATNIVTNEFSVAGNFLRQAVLPQAVRHWTLTTLREKLIKIGAKVVRHSRKIVFQMAEVAVPRELFRSILQAIERLRLATATSG
jgi:UDP-N-acetylglucosamine enolpyruvyl transferase